jgi:hypothetical protein
MFREMRRKKQELSRSECEEILARGTSGVLALDGDNGYPYAVPLSYVYSDGKIIFHCAKSGHKIDAIKRNPRASFCVIDRDGIVPEEYTTYFRSAIAFGKMRIVGNEDEMRAAVTVLAKKYYPEDSPEHREQAIEREFGGLCIIELEIEHLTGKQAKELA